MNALRQALQVFGLKRQLRKLAEECSELATAALHLEDQSNAENEDRLFEEIADVEIMIGQMREHFGDTGIDGYRAGKISRLEKLVRNMSPAPEPPSIPKPAPKPEPKAAPEDSLLSIKDAARVAGISTASMYTAIKKGKIQVIREPGHHPRILRSQARAYAKRKSRSHA